MLGHDIWIAGLARNGFGAFGFRLLGLSDRLVRIEGLRVLRYWISLLCCPMSAIASLFLYVASHPASVCA